MDSIRPSRVPREVLRENGRTLARGKLGREVSRSALPAVFEAGYGLTVHRSDEGLTEATGTAATEWATYQHWAQHAFAADLDDARGIPTRILRVLGTIMLISQDRG